jgi:hypothetical protein
MSEHRIFRGQKKKYDKCLFVPSALRGYWPNHYPLSGIECCNDCINILKVEKFLQDLGIDTNSYKEECMSISGKGPFQDCANDIPYIFWLSIVFCECKISHMGINISFSGGGLIPYPINMGFAIDADESHKCKFDNGGTVEEYAKKMSQYYFRYTPPSICDDFIRNYMAHQHYCKESYSYETWAKMYKSKDGTLIDGNDLPDHFTFLLDWTECRCEAEKFAGDGGSVFSIDSEKYDIYVGANYKMSYNDEIMKQSLLYTSEKQKSVVTFWPWTSTIDELENHETSDLGRELDFRRELPLCHKRSTP